MPSKKSETSKRKKMNGLSKGIALALLLGLGWWVGAEEITPPGGEGGRILEVIVIDPGHGGPDAGARGRKGILEKDVTLRAAQILKELVQEKLGMRAILTREGDYAIPLERRAVLANISRASLFISLHASGAFSPRPGGFQVFSLKAPAGIGRQGGLLSGNNAEVLIPWRQVQLPFVSTSRQLAEAIQRSLNERLHPGEEEGEGSPRELPCAILMGVRMPAVLVELGYLSHPEEEAGLHDEAYMRDLEEAILNGIQAYKLQTG